MNTGDRENIEGYSADYRSAHPQKPKAERPAPKQTGRPGHPSESKKPARSDAKNRVEEKPEAPHRSKAAAQKPQAARKPETVSKPLPVPKSAPKRDAPAPLPQERMENGTEIDDFLPAGEDAGVESYLTKWNDGQPQNASPKKSARKRAGKYRFGLLAGSLVLILALVGVVFIAVEAGTRIHGALTDDSKLRAYDKQLAVVVAQDPQPFASPDKADPDFVLNASLWKVMTQNGSDYTSYDDAGRTIVPLGDVVDACGELFGPKCSLQPKSPSTESFYTYDAVKSQFHIALYSLEGVYEPYTQSAKKEGDSVVLRVGYISPTDPTRASSAGVSSSSGKPAPTKYMEYVLKTNESTKKEYIYAVRKAT